VVVIRRDRRTSEPDAFGGIKVDRISASHLWSSSFKRALSSGTFRFLVRGADEDSGWDVTRFLFAATLTKERTSS
jgi:hypothetical protein